MPSYSNGYIPDSLLITFKTGWNAQEGTWKHQLSAGTYQKHLHLVALAKKNTGRGISITDGWGAYRPYVSQVYARQLYGMGAAWPGTSSHGGFWEGKQTLAIDYDWGTAYGWDRAAWFRDVRAAGLTPGLIHPSRGNGYPDEPWHVVDLDPWVPVTAGGKSVAPATILPEEDDMKLLHITDNVDGGAKAVPGWVLLNTRTGEFLHLRSDGAGNQERANGWARVWGNAKSVTRQDLKNAIAAIKQTA